MYFVCVSIRRALYSMLLSTSMMTIQDKSLSMNSIDILASQRFVDTEIYMHIYMILKLSFDVDQIL